MKHILLLVFALLSTHFVSANEECSQRYQSKVFENIKTTSGILYGSAIMAGGGERELYYDVFEPEGDTLSLRPVIILWHGGAFLDFIKRNSPDIQAITHEMVKRGYVVITPSYRGIKSFTSFLREKDMVQAVVRAVIDGNDAVCHIVSEIENGNPFRIDKNFIFGGGVSAGSVLGLHGLFLETLDDMPENFRVWAREIDGGKADIALANKFCGASVKGFINISGAILDTSFIRPTNIAFLHIHGTDDPIVPYGKGRPLGGLPTLPELNGSAPIHERSLNMGINSTFSSWEGRGHVPFLNLDLAELLQLELFNQAIFDQNIKDITAFLFDKIVCEPERVVSFVKPTNIKSLNVYPNPSLGQFKVVMPEDKLWQIEVRNIAGSLVFSEQFSGSNFSYSGNKMNSNGMYIMQIVDVSNAGNIYRAKITVQK